MKKKIIFCLLIISLLNLRAQSQIDIYHFVPFVPQPTSVSCWSASLAMILWWRDNQDAQMCLADALTPEQVADNLGYWQQYFQDGMDAYDTYPFQVFNFVTVPPMSFPVETLAGFLQNGPLWVAYYGCTNPLDTCGHAVVLVGMRGDGTPENTLVILHDPDAGTGTYPNLGVRDREMAYTEFIQRLNERATYLISLPEAEHYPVTFLAYPRN
jgi:hypothetical protein